LEASAHWAFELAAAITMHADVDLTGSGAEDLEDGDGSGDAVDALSGPEAVMVALVGTGLFCPFDWIVCFRSSSSSSCLRFGLHRDAANVYVRMAASAPTWKRGLLLLLCALLGGSLSTLVNQRPSEWAIICWGHGWAL
jgi:hypothetical protein